MNQICIKCKEEFPSSREYFYGDKHKKSGLQSWCKKCTLEHQSIYRKSDKAKQIHNLSNKKWRQTKKGKETIRKYQQTDKYKQNLKKWQQTEKGKEIQYKDTKRYLSTDKGKQWINRHNHQRREMGYIELIPNPFDKSEKIEWHHIDNSAYVVAIPYDLHRLYYGKNHQENTMKLVNQIYGVDEDAK
jgi:hypothetical protein